MRYRDIIRPVLEGYVSHPPKYVYHGSKTPGIKTFENRKSKRFGFAFEKEVMSQGFFFANSVEEARQFGPHVSAYEIVCRKPLVSSTEGIDSIAPAKVPDFLYIFSSLFEPSLDGRDYYWEGMNFVVHATKEDLTNPSARWFYEFLGPGSLDWECLDNPEFVKRMRERGYDGTVVYEPDVASKHAWFVISPEQIKFVCEVNEYDEDDDY